MTIKMNKNAALEKITLAGNVAGATASSGISLTYSGAFASFLRSAFGSAMTGIGSYLLFPVIAFASAVEATLLWVQVGVDRRRRDNKFKNRHILSALVASLSSLMSIAVLIGFLVVGVVFSQIASVIFMAVIGGRALFNLGSAIYNQYRAVNMDDEARKEKYTQRANEQFISAGLGFVAFAAAAFAFLLGYLVATPVGIAMNAVFFVLSVVGVALGVKNYFSKRKAGVSVPAEENLQQNPEVCVTAVPEIRNEKARVVNFDKTRNWGKNAGIFASKPILNDPSLSTAQELKSVLNFR